LADLPRWQQFAVIIEQAELIQARAGTLAVQDPGSRTRNTGWMPFNLFDFNALLFECLKLIPDGALFLDVGAGNGPFMYLAREIYGFDVFGIEIQKALADDAAEYGLAVQEADAYAWDGYGKAGVLWVNRPLRDRELEAGLEQKIWDEMADGAVAICANLESRPPGHWIIINDSWDSLHRGAWVKPYASDGG
jgi:Methionine biosynthesis protein MetW